MSGLFRIDAESKYTTLPDDGALALVLPDIRFGCTAVDFRQWR